MIEAIITANRKSLGDFEVGDARQIAVDGGHRVAARHEPAGVPTATARDVEHGPA